MVMQRMRQSRAESPPDPFFSSSGGPGGAGSAEPSSLRPYLASTAPVASPTKKPSRLQAAVQTVIARRRHHRVEGLDSDAFRRDGSGTPPPLSTGDGGGRGDAYAVQGSATPSWEASTVLVHHHQLSPIKLRAASPATPTTPGGRSDR